MNQAEIVFLLEEESAKAMIEVIAEKLTANICKFIVFEGKSDLERNIEMKLRHYRNHNALFIILRDQDTEDCHIIKERLLRKCTQSGKRSYKVRIVCSELESWYLADLEAVSLAFQKPMLSHLQTKRKYRNPDLLSNASQELKKLIPEYQKIAGSRAIAQHLDIDNTRSRSFMHFINAVKG